MAQLKKQIQDKLEADAALVAMLGGGSVNSIMPFVRGGVLYEPTSQSPTPFIVLNVGGETAVDWPVISRQDFEIFIYDEPGQSYWAIDRIVTKLKSMFETDQPQFTYDTGEKRADFRTEWEMTSMDSYDPELKKAFKTVRFGIWA